MAGQLLYADDLAVIAETEEELNQQCQSTEGEKMA